MPLAQNAERERRLRTASLGLVLLAWGLGVGPVAHAVLAHGAPLERESGDQGWVQHAVSERGSLPTSRETPAPHHHAPGALEHLQLAAASVSVTLTVAVVLVAVAASQSAVWEAPALSRWRFPEVPGAP
jgi:hypothetical protein